MTITLGIKMWGGRRYLVDVEPNEDTTIAIFAALGLEVSQCAEVIIDMSTKRYLKNRGSDRMVADSLDTVVYEHGNAQPVGVCHLRGITNVLHRNR